MSELFKTEMNYMRVSRGMYMPLPGVVCFKYDTCFRTAHAA